MELPGQSYHCRLHATALNLEAEALLTSGAYLGYRSDHLADQFVAAGRIAATRPDLLPTKPMFKS